MTTPLYENPSKTAFTASLLRAFATKEADPNIQGSDDMVFLFLEDNILPAYNDNEKRQLFLDETYKAGGYVYMIARTKLIDHLFQSGHIIIIFTARYMGRYNDNLNFAKKKGCKFTIKQLNN